jgi:hypothetical protein
MPHDQSLRDTKNNFVVVTLFESYLSRFILERPHLYKGPYCKVLDAIDLELKKHSEKLDIDRHLFTIFSRVNESYQGYLSFDDLKHRFRLESTDYCLKLIADELLLLDAPKIKGKSDPGEIPSPPSFFNQSQIGRKSPYNPARCPLLFSEQHRGVFIADDSSRETQDMGIVDEKYVPDALKDYFMTPICPAKFTYQPNEESYIALWLRSRHLPVIAGSSGSTETLFSGILPLVSLDPEEIEIIVFSQACNMVANGHHSLFEALKVADHFGLKIRDTKSLFEFYIQCIPASIKSDPAFSKFINEPIIKELLEDMPLYIEGARQEIVNVPGV